MLRRWKGVAGRVVILVVLVFTGTAGVSSADVLVSPPPVPAYRPSYYGIHNQRVMDHMLHFTLSATPEQGQNRLELLRERDRLLLWRDLPVLDGRGVALGVGLFALATVITAHTPHGLRLLVDHRLHLAPSVSEATGMGLAVGGTFTAF